MGQYITQSELKDIEDNFSGNKNSFRVISITILLILLYLYITCAIYT